MDTTDHFTHAYVSACRVIMPHPLDKNNMWASGLHSYSYQSALIWYGKGTKVNIQLLTIITAINPQK